MVTNHDEVLCRDVAVGIASGSRQGSYAVIRDAACPEQIYEVLGIPMSTEMCILRDQVVVRIAWSLQSGHSVHGA